MIARSPHGPRGDGVGGDDSYDNLILLCPNHHGLVDKAEERFPPDTLRQWKRDHEAAVSEALRAPAFTALSEVARYVQRLLAENRELWARYGPESPAAAENPLTTATRLWTAHKLRTIIPNNRRIINVVRRHREYFEASDYRLAAEFITHAEGFETNAYAPTEGVPRFPANFAEMIDARAQ